LGRTEARCVDRAKLQLKINMSIIVGKNLAARLNLERTGTLVTAAGILFGAICAQGVTFVTDPSFSAASNAPLAGVLQVTTDVDSRVSVSVDDGLGTWQRNFFDYGQTHSITLAGFKANRTNQITVTVRDKSRNQFTSPQPLLFTTGPLPSDFPVFVLRSSQPEKMEPGYTVFRAADNNYDGGIYEVIVDNQGQIVWYGSLPTSIEMRPLANGDLFIPTSDAAGFAEFNLLGQIVNSWAAPVGLPVDIHEALYTDHGTILYINNTQRVVTNFPSSSTDPNAPLAVTNVSCNQIVEMSATNSALLNTWSLIDMLDPTRIDYLTFLIPYFGVDAEHANAITEDPRDNSLIVSMRNQDAVVKFSRTTGQLKWILGPHDNWGPEWQPYLLNPIGPSFQWQYGQHAPVITPQGTLLLYDDGNVRAEPFDATVADSDNYSRAVEYSIDETNMQVSQVWEYGRTNDGRLYTDRIGSAFWLPQRGNVLVTFGFALYENGAPPSAIATNATMARIKEVTHDSHPEVVFDLQVFDPNNTDPGYLGCFVYRSYRIPDLYAHPAAAVTDLTLQYDGATPVLQFSGDQARSYQVEVSGDVVNWQAIGTASLADGSGDFSFVDNRANGSSRQFYRIATQ
jgi:hypothetical protein